MIFNHEGDTALFSQLLKGDEKAFDRIYDAYFSILFQYCIRFTPDRSLIKDVLQDFFLRLLTRKERLPEVNDPGRYLMVSVRRELLRRLTKASRLPVEAMTGEDYAFHLELSPENVLIDKQSGEHQSRHLQDTIDGLTPRQKEAIYLYFYNDSSYEEIAEIMGLKEVKYARTLVYRALSELRLVFKGDGSLLGRIIS
jgi:RNA polymerase sigma factor (sigma-70 family)